jgi:hypothetical protein
VHLTVRDATRELRISSVWSSRCIVIPQGTEVAAVAEDAATDVLSAGGSAVEAEDAAVDAAEDELVKEETEAAEDQSVPEGQVRHTVTRHTQRCTSCESERQSLARGDRKCPPPKLERF